MSLRIARSNRLVVLRESERAIDWNELMTVDDPKRIDAIRDRVYEELSQYCCDVCDNSPQIDEVYLDSDEPYGMIQHGRGCYVVDEDGGGASSIRLPRELAERCVLLTAIDRRERISERNKPFD